MKFWKSIVYISTLVIAVASVAIYSSCEKNACNDVNCMNGGSCSNGACKCPPGYDGAMCGARSTDRYVGYYSGFTYCNNGAAVIDTIFITGNIPHTITTLMLIQKTHVTDVLYGTVDNNETTYAINIPDRVDSAYRKQYHVTLQSDNKLVFDTYEYDTTTAAGPIINKCTFVGTKH